MSERWRFNRRLAFRRAFSWVAVWSLASALACNSLVNRQSATTVIDDLDSGGALSDGPVGTDGGDDAEGADARPPDSTGPDGGDASVNSPMDAALDARGEVGADAGKEGGVELLTGDEFQIHALLVTGNHVVWNDFSRNTIRECDPEACVPRTLASPHSLNTLATDGTTLYWGEFTTGEILSLPLAGAVGGPTQLAVNQTSPRAIVRDGASLVWHTADDGGKIRACTLASCAATVHDVASATTTPYRIASAASVVYWVDGISGAVLHCPIAGCAGTPEVLTSIESTDLAVAVGHVYFASRTPSVVMRCALSNCASPTTIGSSYSPRRLATDGADVYWTNGPYRQLLRCPAAGCGAGPTVVAGYSMSGELSSIAMTPDYVYFTTTYEVRRVAR